MVFVVGGNGGNAAAHAIAEECEAQGVVCSVVGVPKSIDNDILLVGVGETGSGASCRERRRPGMRLATQQRCCGHNLSMMLPPD